jgi:hypothetical protein
MASRAETLFAETMDDDQIYWQYEPEKFDWIPPKRKYTPDFKVAKRDGGYFFVEYKGYLRPADRTKMRAIKKQYPDLDIRFVFQKADKKLYKGSKTEYWMWAEQWGFPWAEKEIPEEWL